MNVSPTPILSLNGIVVGYSWTLHRNQDADPIEIISFVDPTVQYSGEFFGACAVLMGTIDGIRWQPLTLPVSEERLLCIKETVLLAKPVLDEAMDDTIITVSIIGRFR